MFQTLSIPRFSWIITECRNAVACAPVEPDGQRRVAGEDQQPEQKRSLLPTPERGERVADRQLAADVLRHVREREVATRERGPQHAGRDERRRERSEQRVLGGQREAALPRPRRVRAGNEGVRDEPEVEQERCAAELGHYVLLLVFAGA